MKLSRRALSIKPSPTLAASARAKALARAGKEVVNFGAGEPDFDTPEHIKEAAARALEEGFTKYTATSGIPELKDAIAAKMKREFGQDYSHDEIIVSCGGKHALYNLFMALLDPGDEVIVLAPYWVSYVDMIELCESKAVIVDTRTRDGFALDVEKVRRALTPRTRAVVVNSPSNPTGAVYSHESLLALCALLRSTPDLVAITDDIYERILYGGRKFENVLGLAPDLRPRTAVVNSLSKTYAMTGWRIGYTCAPRELVGAMGRIQDQSTSNPTSIAQKAAVAALTGPQDVLDVMLRAFDERRGFVVRALNAIPGVRCPDPGGAFYVFPDVSELLRKRYKGGPPLGTSSRFCEALLEDELVSCVPGGPFGGEGSVRVSFATSMEQIEKGVARIARFAAALA